MKRGIDWAAIERARLGMFKVDELQPGWFTVQMYAKQRGVKRSHAGTVLKKMHDAGLVERMAHGKGYAFRLRA